MDYEPFPPNGEVAYIPVSMSQYLETYFLHVLDGLTCYNPYLSAPYLEVSDKEAGVYEVTILMHVHPQKERQNVDKDQPI